MRTLVLVICFGTMGAASSLASAQNQCWIDRVEQAPNGVKIFFVSHPLKGVVRKPGELGGEGFYHDTAQRLVVRREERLDHLFLANGYEAAISQMHSGCTLAIEMGGDRIWLAGYGSNAMPGKAPQRTEVRIEARKRKP